MFQDGHCRDHGFTAFALQELSKVRIVPVTGATIGVSGGVPEDIFQACLCHMQEWQKVAQEICDSEFPNFRLLHAYRILDIDVEDPLNVQGSTGRAAYRELQGQIQKCTEVLAKFFEVPADTLLEEVTALKPLACEEMLDTGCSAQEAWRRTLQTKHRKNDYNVLRSVLLNYVVHDGSTSVVERGFAVTRSKIKKQQGNSTEIKENILTKVLLDRPVHQQELDEVLECARKVWSECFGIPRASGSKRRRRKRVRASGGADDDDGDTKRPKVFASEAEFVRERKASVDELARSAQPGPLKTLSVELGQEAQQEISFQRKRKFERMVEAHDHGILEAKFITDKFKKKLKAFKVNQAKNERQRERKAMETKAILTRDTKNLGLTPKYLGRHGLFVDETARGVLKPWLKQWGCQCSPDRVSAGVFVVQDPNNAPRRIMWVAVLKGGYLVTPDSFKNDGIVGGPLVKLLPALSSKFRILLQPGFREKQPVFSKVLDHFMGMKKCGFKWTHCRLRPGEYRSGKTLVFCGDEADQTEARRQLPKATCRCLTVNDFEQQFWRVDEKMSLQNVCRQ